MGRYLQPQTIRAKRALPAHPTPRFPDLFPWNNINGYSRGKRRSVVQFIQEILVYTGSFGAGLLCGFNMQMLV
jgi:hypothetical protein